MTTVLPQGENVKGLRATLNKLSFRAAQWSNFLWDANLTETGDAMVLVFGLTDSLLSEVASTRTAVHCSELLLVFARWFFRVGAGASVARPLHGLKAFDPHRLLMARIGNDERRTVVCSTIRVGASYEIVFAALWLCHCRGDTAQSQSVEAVL